MPKPTPNPQAVEAFYKALDSSKEPHEALLAAEPHIRSQLLTELAEEFKNRELITQREANRAGSRGEMDAQAFERGRSSGFGAAASHCRELAAKEE